MPLHPQARAVIEQLEALGAPDMTTLEPAVARQLSLVTPDQPVEAVARLEDRQMPGAEGDILVRVYWPEGEGPHPALIYYHGGGFVLCGLDTHDGVCRSIANAASCVVVSVDYRLAPEDRYPAAPEDCYAVTRHVSEKGAELGIDTSRIAIGGDSAGGNLAAVVSLMARDRSGPSLCHQLLVYPVTDCAFDTASYRDNAEGYFLTTKMMRWFWDLYLPDGSAAAHAYASPLRAESLTGLPPATVITAEFDPLRDEGEAYAARLREAGVSTTLTRYDGMIHGFFSMGIGIDDASRAIEEAATGLRGAFRG